MGHSSHGIVIAAFCLLQASALAAVSQGEIRITEYGARGDGKELCTDAIDRAMKACAESGGGTVLVPAGAFLTGPIKLPSHVMLHLAAGAVLALQHGRDAIIRNCIAAEGTATFLSHEDVAGDVLLANNDLGRAANAVSPATDKFTLTGNLVSK